MWHDEHTSRDYSVVLRTKLLGADEAPVIKETRKQWGDFIGTPFLNQLYEEHLSENDHAILFLLLRRQDKRWQWCVMTFLLFQVCYTIIFDKRNKHINDEFIIEDDHARDHPSTLGIIWTLHDMVDEGCIMVLSGILLGKNIAMTTQFDGVMITSNWSLISSFISNNSHNQTICLFSKFLWSKDYVKNNCTEQHWSSKRFCQKNLIFHETSSYPKRFKLDK